MFNFYATVILILSISIVAFWYNLFKKNSDLFISFYTIVFVPFWQLISCLYVETGVYIVEEGTYGNFNCASLALLIFWFVLMTGFLFGLGPHQEIAPSSSREKDISLWPYLAFLWVCLTILSINLVLSPIPLLTPGVDRFDYWEASRFPFLRYFFGNTAQFIPIMLGLLLVKTGMKRRKSLFFILTTFLFYILYVLMIGHKFGSFIVSLFVFILPTVVTSTTKWTFNFKKVCIWSLVMLILAGGLYGIIYYQYSIYSDFTDKLGLSVGEAIFYRAFALQGHLWWGTFDGIFIQGEHSPTLNLEDLLEGMINLMFFVTHDRLNIAYSLERGVTFTNGYPAILIYVFPIPLALFFNFIIGFLLGLFARPCIGFIKRGDIIFATVFLQAFLFLEYAAETGRFANIVEVKTFAIFGLIFLLIFWKFIAQPVACHLKYDSS